MTTDGSRHATLRQFATAALDDPLLELAPASVDASFRSYWRSTGKQGCHVVMDAPPEHENIAPWLGVAARLDRAGVHVPHVVASDASQGFVLMEDLGNRTYLPELDDASVDALYGDALDALLKMQTTADAEGLPAYDRDRLIIEMRLLPTWFLERHLGASLDPATNAVIEQAFDWLASVAAEQPTVFVHRDYHSRNLLITDRGNPGVIDFQDAVLGPLTYDLVSLLRDCYIEWEDARVEGWVEGYRQRALAERLIDASVDANQFRRWFDLIGIQRHIKVLGIFCRLWYRDGKSQYLGDLTLVWRYTIRIARRYPELADLVAVLEAAVGDRDLTHAISPSLA
ncbi:MAG: phosphotransferase [Dokdonella sp.]